MNMAAPGTRGKGRVLAGLVKSWPWLKWLLAAVMLGALYYAAQWHELWHALWQLDAGWLLCAMALFVPQTLLSACRWRCLARWDQTLSLGVAVAHTLAAAALNLTFPAKTGDFLRGGFRNMKPQHFIAGALCTLREKIADVAVLLVLVGLGLWCSASIAVTLLALLAACNCATAVWPACSPPWRHTMRLLWQTALLWALHMLQIACFFRTAGVLVPWDTFLARTPLALFAGLIPLTPWGLGTRDLALAVLFDDVAPTAALAVIGLLMTTRYLVPGVMGLPFLTIVSSRALRERIGQELSSGIDMDGDRRLIMLPPRDESAEVEEPAIPMA